MFSFSPSLARIMPTIFIQIRTKFNLISSEEDYSSIKAKMVHSCGVKTVFLIVENQLPQIEKSFG